MSVLLVFGTLCLYLQFSVGENLYKNEPSFRVSYEEVVFDSYVNMTDLENYPNVCDEYQSEVCAQAWLFEMDLINKRNNNRMTNAQYRYSTDINPSNEELKMRLERQLFKIEGEMKNKLRKFQWKLFKSSKLRTNFQILTSNIKSKNESILKRLLNIKKEVENIFVNGQPCFGWCLTKGLGGITHLFETERDYDKLSGFWSSWMNVTGRKIRKLFIERMHLENIGAKENGYSDASSFELYDEYEDDNIEEEMKGLYEGVVPLYKELHGYVRHCLSRYYPHRFNNTGPIPAHILGDVWAQRWDSILPILLACQGKVRSNNMREEADKKLKSFSLHDIIKMAENFYTSMGMFEMTPYFWNRSVLEKPRGRLMDCHAFAIDFSNDVDYRIIACLTKNIKSLSLLHHEMGHVEYFMASRHLPYFDQVSPIHALHEVVGDTVTLSFRTPEHLKIIGLLSEVPNTKEFDIEYLLESALEKLPNIPFAFTMINYIWSVYNGSVDEVSLNKHWWNLTYQYQGLAPPIQRTENDFDPASKYHIAYGRPYSKYFLDLILQFQVHEAMCKLIGHSGPLHRCNIYRYKAPGRRLLEFFSHGSVLPWRNALKLLTGSRQMSVAGLLRFYNPLYKWLRDTNRRLGVPIGW